MSSIPQDQLLIIVAFLEAAGTSADHEARLGAIINNLSPETLARMLLQFPWTRPEGDPDGSPNLPFVGHVAEVLGPDWAQAFYHFAVRVTKAA